MLNYNNLTDAEHAVLDNIHCACATIQGIQAVYLLTEEVIRRKVEGDFVECGVFVGGLAIASALALKKHGQDRTFHLFDSWQGMPLAGPKDDQQPGIGPIQHDQNLPLRSRLVSSGTNVCGVNDVKTNLYRYGVSDISFRFYPGWFQDTLPALPKGSIPKIAFLHLDADLYESTLIALEHFYPNVVENGLVVIDDYLLAGCQRAFKDYFKNPPEVKCEIDYGAAYFFKHDSIK